MSLLMEALRKAEEAKSKASQEDKKPAPPAPASEAAATDNPEKPDSGKTTSVSQPDKTAPGQGAFVINPDPDEEEILASHTAGLGLELVEKEPVPEPEPESDDPEDEFKQYFPDEPFEPEADATGVQADNVTEASSNDEDEGLSLMQSGYFSRTQRSGSGFVDDDLDEPEPRAFDNEAESQMAEEVNEEVLPEALEDYAPQSLQEEAAPSPVADRKAEEKAKRDSANALFLAKDDSRQRRLKKLVPIAAVLLVVPLAGIVYWLVTSLNSGSDMQFNVPANANFANRSLSDFQAQPGAGEAVPVPQADTGAIAIATGQPDGADTALENQSTATAMMAVADNAADTPPAATVDPEPEVAEPLPALEQQVAAITPPPPAQETIQTTNANPANTATAAAPARQVTAQENGLSFTRTTPDRTINPDLTAAYDSYQEGDYAIASRLYQQVLSSEPNNRDAMLHLASVYQKLNNAAMAQTLYSRLLELNPRDPLARAGLLESLQGDPVRQESELKSMIAAFPDTAQLSFALGNLYATQNRWNEAQAAYFDALLAAKSNNSGPVSPDYAFNLAVSLERINQLRTALDYYREAETQSRNSTPGFDPALLAQRLNYLEQRLR